MRTSFSPYHHLYIDCGAIIHNFNYLRGLMPKGSHCAAVIKADAYGHGALHLAPLLKAAGAGALAVTRVSEALNLRDVGIEGPLWLLMGAHVDEADQVAAYNLWPITDSPELLEALDMAARKHNRPVNCLIKMDTGMNRLGLAPEDIAPFLERAAQLPGLKIAGLVSHLAFGGVAPACQPQVEIYNQALLSARAMGLALEDSSLLNSGGVMAPPAHAYAQAQWTRLGIALYGGLPDPGLAAMSRLKPTMGLSSQVLAVHGAKAGSRVSYGGTWYVERDTTLAVVPIGYAEGYPRSLSNQGHMLINGQKAPIRGRVCMNMTMVEVSHIKPLPRPGDEVVLLGRQGDEEISVDELAALAGTISYEIMCGLGACLPHNYLPYDPEY